VREESGSLTRFTQPWALLAGWPATLGIKQSKSVAPGGSERLSISQSSMQGKKKKKRKKGPRGKRTEYNVKEIRTAQLIQHLN
jgi:hypothetical protein